MDTHTQTDPVSARSPACSAFPLNRMVFSPSTDGAPAEALWPSVTCTVFRAGYWECAADWWLRQRIMPNYILFICVSGGADFVLGGRAHRLQPGGVLLAPPHVPQEGRHDPLHPLRVYALHFAAHLYGVLDMPTMYRLPVTLRPQAAHMALIVDAVRRILGEFAGAAPGHTLVVNAECARILAILWREMVARDPGRSSDCWEHATDMARLVPVFRMIQARYAQRLTLGELAQAVPFHPAYFSSYFKRVTGISPLRYLARYRLDRARELLLSTDRSIAAIAAATGHRDPSYFGRLFRRTEGMRPGAYRRVQRDRAVI